MILDILKRKQFASYFGVEALFVLYLGIWNSIIPLLVMQHGGVHDLILYETALAIVAAFSAPLLGVIVENRSRAFTIKVGCCIILAASVLRYLVLDIAYVMSALICVDLFAVLAFGAVQPLLGIYPAETVESEQTEIAFRLQRTLRSFGRIAAPGAVVLALIVLSPIHALLVGAVISLFALCMALTIPSTKVIACKKRQSVGDWIGDLSLGLRVCVQIPPERFFTVTNFGLLAAIACILPVVVPLLVKKHNLPLDTLALCNSAYAAGLLFGAAIWSAIAAKLLRPKAHFIFAFVVIGFSLVSLTAAKTGVWMAVCVFPIGAVYSSVMLLGFGKRNLAIPKSARVRLMATNIMFSQLASSVGFVGAGLIFTALGEIGLMLWFIGILVPLIVYGIYSKSPWELLATSHDGVAGFYVTRFPIAAKLFS